MLVNKSQTHIQREKHFGASAQIPFYSARSCLPRNETFTCSFSSFVRLVVILFAWICLSLNKKANPAFSFPCSVDEIVFKRQLNVFMQRLVRFYVCMLRNENMAAYSIARKGISQMKCWNKAKRYFLWRRITSL